MLEINHFVYITKHDSYFGSPQTQSPSPGRNLSDIFYNDNNKIIIKASIIAQKKTNFTLKSPIHKFIAQL